MRSRFESLWMVERRDAVKSLARVERKVALDVENLEGRLLMAAGYFDKSFARTGHTIVTWPGTSSSNARTVTVEATTVQADGKIIVVGEIPPRTILTGLRQRVTGDIGVARLNQNGSLDSSFGTAGRNYLVFASGGPLGSDKVRGVAIDSAGRIVIAGTGLRTDGSQEIVTERLTPNGSIDKTYGIAGRSYAGSTIAGLTGYVAKGLAIDSQGRIVVAATVLKSNGQNELGAIRLNSNGNYDQSFGNQGQSHQLLAIVDVNNDEASGVAIDSQGGILVAGTVSGNGQNDFGVIRLQTDGSTDVSFGNLGRNGYGAIPGFLVNNPTGLQTTTSGIAVDAEGRIVLSGILGAQSTPSGYHPTFSVVRLTTQGRLDQTFGVGGFSSAGFPLGTGLQNTGGAVTIDSSERIVLVGSAFDGKRNHSVVTRLLANGSFDPSFGIGGRSDAGYGRSYSGGDTATAVAIDTAGRIVIGGSVTNNFGVERILG